MINLDDICVEAVYDSGKLVFLTLGIRKKHNKYNLNPLSDVLSQDDIKLVEVATARFIYALLNNKEKKQEV